MTEIVQNNITKQGSTLDVAHNFNLSSVISKSYTYNQLRLLVGSESLAEKVVSYLPRTMGDVSFSIGVIGRKKRVRTISEQISWCNTELRKMIPWFVDAQIQANIVGKSYLIFDSFFDSPSKDFPLLHHIDWIRDSVTGLNPLRVVPHDLYKWNNERTYLHKITNSITGDITETKINKWISNLNKLDIDKYQYDFIEASHVIEFTAFDYQNDTETIKYLTNNYIDNSSIAINYRLTRFIPSLLRYLSFISATLNRMHRSEAVVYKKDNLGDISVELAKYVATQTGLSSSDSIQFEVDASQLIEQELERIQRCLTNFGVVMTDSKNSIDMLSRNMTGVDKLQDVFKHDVIASSGLTEFALFAVTGAGGGLANMDIRDRAAIAKQTDQLFKDHWSPLLLYLANCLLINFRDSHIFNIDAEQSFKLSELESSEWLERRVKVLLDLLDRGVIDKNLVRRELASNNALGHYFMITDSDVEILNENDLNIDKS